MKTIFSVMFAALIALSFSACSPDPGTKAWCNQMKEKPKAQWTAEDAGTFTKHCVIGNYKK